MVSKAAVVTGTITTTTTEDSNIQGLHRPLLFRRKEMIFKTLKFFSIDIETKNLNDKEVEFETQFLKHHPSTKDPAKQKLQIEEKAQKLRTRGALTNTCEIASIAFYTDSTRPIVFNTLKDIDLEEYGMKGHYYETEAEMLAAFTEFVNETCDEETVIVVANRDFDLPKIRYACIKNRIQMPEIMRPEAENRIYDVLFMGSKYFMIGNTFSVGLDEISERLGVGTGGKAVSGKEVPGMIERGEFTEVLVYNGLDAIKTTECYLLMTGRY